MYPQKSLNKLKYTYSPDEVVLAPCRDCAVLARAKSVITVRLVGFIPVLGAPKSGRLRAILPPVIINYT